jgi:hypothetical protein
VPAVAAASSAVAVKSMAASTPWTGTWSVSPQSGGPSFSQQGTVTNYIASGDVSGNASLSQTALTNAGAAPGASVTSSGVSFTFPNVAAGTDDNTVAEGQAITMTGSGGWNVYQLAFS